MTARNSPSRHRPATFKGAGSPKGTWKRRRYFQDGTVLEDGEQAPAVPKRGVGIHTRFQPFIGHNPTAEDAKALGLKRTPDKGTVFETEKQLNEYLAHEKRNGRSACWKDH